jgi:hypothetical protein
LKQRVIAPGGPRDQETVHHVGHDHSVLRGVPEEEALMEHGNFVPPKEHVLTPGGWRHKERVHHLTHGHHLVRHSGGITVCDLHGKAVHERPSQEQTPPVKPAGSGWITYAGWFNNTGAPVAAFQTSWAVPPPPATGKDQTLFLFNAIEDRQLNDILQPVLQWGPSAAGEVSGQWSIASWFVDPKGHAFHTDLIPVPAGETLLGWMFLTGQAAGSFDYLCEFAGYPGTRLEMKNTSELLWCTETLETYGVQKCSDYPNTLRTPMFNIGLATTAGWAPLTWTPRTPVHDCGQGVVIVNNSATGGQVDLYYRGFPVAAPAPLAKASGGSA